jgi:hypothetical protein
MKKGNSRSLPAQSGIPLKMDRTIVSFSSREDHYDDEKEYWSKATAEDKCAMITYLRECFYGVEATTGRLQRFFEFSKQE